MIKWELYDVGGSYSEALYTGTGYLGGYIETDRGGSWGNYEWQLQADPTLLSAADRALFYGELTQNRDNNALLSGSFASIMSNPSAVAAERKKTDAAYSSSVVDGQCMLTDNSGFVRDGLGVVERAAEYLIPQYLEITASFGQIEVFIGVSRLLQTQSENWDSLRGVEYLQPNAKDIAVNAAPGDDLPTLLATPFGAPPVSMVGDYSGSSDSVYGLQTLVAHHPSKVAGDGGVDSPALLRAWYAHDERNAPDATWTRFATGRSVDVVDDVPIGYTFDAATGKAYQSFVPRPILPSGTVCSCCVHALDFPVTHKAAVWAIAFNDIDDSFPPANWAAALWAYDPEVGWVKLSDIDLPKQSFSVDDFGWYYQGYGLLINETLTEPLLTNPLPEYHLAITVSSDDVGDVALDRANGFMWCGMSSRDFLRGKLAQMPSREPIYSLARAVV